LGEKESEKGFNFGEKGKALSPSRMTGVCFVQVCPLKRGKKEEPNRGEKVGGALGCRCVTSGRDFFLDARRRRATFSKGGGSCRFEGGT